MAALNLADGSKSPPSRRFSMSPEAESGGAETPPDVTPVRPARVGMPVPQSRRAASTVRLSLSAS